MRQRQFARAGHRTAAGQAGGGDGVVRAAERARGNQGLPVRQYAGDGVYFGNLQRFVKGQIGQNSRKPLGQHGFAGSRRADQQDIVIPRRRNF